MRVVVIGGGVIGLSCAYALSQRGAQATVLERDECGQATSAGNGGWVTRALSAPLPAPGVPMQSLRRMLRRESPLWIRPRANLAFLRWCWQFWRSCNEEAFRRGISATIGLNQHTSELFADLARDGVDFERHDRGLVYVARSASALSEFERLFALLAELGYGDEIKPLRRDELLELEPALSPSVHGGLHVKSDWHLRPESLVSGLLAVLRRSGVALQEHTPVIALAARPVGWVTITESGEEIDCDAVLVAAGSWSSNVLETVGLHLPLEAAKGYSFTAEGTGSAPAHALYFAEAKVGCSPFDGDVRIAGTVELAGLDLSLPQKRVDALMRATTRYLRDWRPRLPYTVWAGLRPLAPDGLPFIGPAPGHQGLYVATGHGMLGVTQGPATSVAVASMILDGREPPELAPFSLARLAHRKAPRRPARRRAALSAC